MTRSTRLFAIAIATAAAALPAATADAAKPSRAATVGAHVKKAQGAQARVATLIHRGDVAGATRVLKVARREATTAAHQAIALADAQPSSDNAVWSLTAAAGNFGTAIQQFAALLPQASGAMQQLIANAIPGSIAGRDELVATLTDLVSKLSGTAQSAAAQALAALQSTSPDQVTSLADTAATDLPDQIATIINSALAAASQALKTGLSTLTGILPQLPSDAQAPVAGALDKLSSLIDGLLPAVQDITTQVTGIVKQVISFVQGLVPDFSSFLPGGSSDASSSTDVTPTAGGIGSLLSSFTGMVPGFGGMFSKLFA